MMTEQLEDSNNVMATQIGSHFRGGEGIFGSHLVGGSFNFKFFLPENATITVGMITDYQWYYGSYRLLRYKEDFDMNLESGLVDTDAVYFGERKGSLSYEAGINVHVPEWVTINAAWVARVFGSFGFTPDEGIMGRRPNTFVSLRTDWHVMEGFSRITPLQEFP